MEPSQTSSPISEGPWGRGGVVAAEESIKLIPKIRPSTTPGLPDYVKYVGHKALTLSAPGAENAHWDFDFVASPHTRQSSFFRVAGRPMADHFLAFYNAAIIAYGQTGSGKTHTMLGSLPADWTTKNLASGCFEDMPREAGLIPRVLGYIFHRIATESNCTGSGHHHSNAKQLAAEAAVTGVGAGVRQLPQPPPATMQPCSTPESVRPRGRSGIPTPNGVPQRPGYLTPPPASPQGTPEPPARAAQKPPPVPPPRNKPVKDISGGGGGSGTEYLIKASMLQIYQEVVTDLLNPRPVRLQIRESMEGGVMVVGLSEITVRSAAEALQLLRVGTSHRAVAETASNPVSSRSHCILTLHMEAKDKMDTGVVRIRRSRLQLVDLAGSERTSKAADYGTARQKETNAINKSLSTLGLVISRLTDRTRSQGPVPYRDSKLTFLLQDCLGGNAKTLIVANLNPSPTCAGETNMTLGFALRAKRVRNRAVVNEDHQGDAVVLQGEVRRLREELSIFRTLHAKDGAPQGIEELSAWRDQAAARVSKLHQALQLNGELEEKLVEMEAVHSRLRMEHAALEEQSEAQRCEMSALEATVEQCEDELHELRARPTLEQLQAVEEALREALRERDDARAQHVDAEQQIQQLQYKCSQLMETLAVYQQQRRRSQGAADGGGRPEPGPTEHERHSASLNDAVTEAAAAVEEEEEEEEEEEAEEEEGDVVLHSVEERDYVTLAHAYSELQGSYAALVEQNCQLLQQLEEAVHTLEVASADADAAEAAEAALDERYPRRGATAASNYGPRHRYHLTESCLISGGLEAVMESTDELSDDGRGGDGNNLAFCVPGSEGARGGGGGGAHGHEDYRGLQMNSPSEHVRLASPASTDGGSGGQDACSAAFLYGMAVLPGPPQRGSDACKQARKRSRSQSCGEFCCSGGGGDGASTDWLRSSTGVSTARRPSLPDGSVDCDQICLSARPYTNRSSGIRPLSVRQVQSAREVEDRFSVRHDDSDDAAGSRSLGTLVRVNPLFECRTSGRDDHLRGAEREDDEDCEDVEVDVEVVVEVTSTRRKSSNSGEGTTGSDSLVCELPMPPDEKVTPWAEGGGGLTPPSSCSKREGKSCCHSGGATESGSTTGVVQHADDEGARMEGLSIMGSGARDRDSGRDPNRLDRDRSLLLTMQRGSPCTSVLAVMELRGSKDCTAGLTEEPSFRATPCSRPQSVDSGGTESSRRSGQAPSGGSRSCVGNGSYTYLGACGSPASPESTFGGFVGGAVAAAEVPDTSVSVARGRSNNNTNNNTSTNNLSRLLSRQPPRSSPFRDSPSQLLTYSLRNSAQENRSPLSNRTNIGLAMQRGSIGLIATSSCTAQSPSTVTGINGPSPLGLRSASRNASGGLNSSSTAKTRSPTAAAAFITTTTTAGAIPAFKCTDVIGTWPGNSRVGSTLFAASFDEPLTHRSGGGGDSGGCSHSGVSSPAVSERSCRTRRGRSWVREEQLAENVTQLEEELARRLQGEMQLRIKLQEALTEGQSAAAQASNLLALNNGMVEEIMERDERLRNYEELVGRLYSELKAILRQGFQPGSETPLLMGPTTAASESSSLSAGSAVHSTDANGEGAALSSDPSAAPADSEPATISPSERPRIIQSFETGAGSPLGFGARISSFHSSLQHFRSSASRVSVFASPRLSQELLTPQGSQHGVTAVDLSSSPLRRLLGPVQVDGPSSAMKTGLMMLLARLRDGLTDRNQRVLGLEEELTEARTRLQRVEKELQKLQEAWQQGLMNPGTEGELTPPPTDTITDADVAVPVATDTAEQLEAEQLEAEVPEAAILDENGFIAPPSPVCSDPDPHPAATWSGSHDQHSLPSPLESSIRREANLQAQLHSRDCQVFELLERKEQLEAALQAAFMDRDRRVSELQSHATRLASNLQGQLWCRNTAISELQGKVAELDTALQRTTAEAVRFRQQMMEAAEQCDRYALELRGLERREELLMNKLRAMEMSLVHRTQETEALRAQLTNTVEQLSGMRAKAMAAEVEAAHARQAAASFEDQLDDIHRKMGLIQEPPPPLSHRQRSLGEPMPYTVATIRPTGTHAHPPPWQPHCGSQGPPTQNHFQAHLPYIYSARSDGSTVEGPSMTYQLPSLPHMDYGFMGHHGMASGGSMGGGGGGGGGSNSRSLGRPSRNIMYSQASQGGMAAKGSGHVYSKGGNSRGHVSAPAATGMEHAAVNNKGTWVQRFLCRKGVSVDGSPGQEAHVAILTPAKWRTKGMTGIVLRQWVAGNGVGKTGVRRGG